MRRKKQVLSIVLITLVTILFLIPLVYMLSTSLKPKEEVLQNTAALFGSYFAVENYARAWNAFPFGRYLFNSIFVGVATTVVTVVTSAMAAYAFARLKFRGRDKLFFAYLATLMVPLQVTIIPLYMILRTGVAQFLFRINHPARVYGIRSLYAETVFPFHSGGD